MGGVGIHNGTGMKGRQRVGEQKEDTTTYVYRNG